MKTPKLDSFISETNNEKKPEKIVAFIQSGHEEYRNELINSYKPFIRKVLSKVCKRYIDQSMDEYSIGLFAFNEAINQYKPGQGSKFLSFADMVIQRRIIDYIRKETRHKKHTFLEQEASDEDGQQEESVAEQRAALEHFKEKELIEERIHDIENYQSLLSRFGITFKVLSKQCPKHIDARDHAKMIAKLIADSSEFSSYLQEKKQLPIKELLNHVECSRKTIERNRKYIIAVSLIYIGGFTSLQSYIEPEMS